jgi:N6-L-threonylcarbamoyladenine synthase
MKLFLGLDTSAYTTSLAVVDSRHEIIVDERIPLTIKPGERGLRQSQALFFHVRNLPRLFERLQTGLSREVAAIAASAWPRRVEGSYMPVFLSGFNQAQTLARFNGLPCYAVSHQEGHIMAALLNNEELLRQVSFIAVHFSGGTSEILQVTRHDRHFLQIETGLSGLDLHAGQLVDRIGVAMGLGFPAGPALEQMAARSSGRDVPRLVTSVSGAGFSFSGVEAQCMRLLEARCPPEDIALGLFRAVGRTLEKVLIKESMRLGSKHILLAGGVMANQFIKQHLIGRLCRPASGFKLYFAEPGLCSDNAVGVARLAAVLHHRETSAI